MCTAELRTWLRQPDPEQFPYDAVVRSYHSAGKHFVPADVLELLDRVRAELPNLRGPWPKVRSLAAFLDTALDKLDNRYRYPTYLALSLLELPTADDPAEQAPFAQSRCDRLTTQLIADVLMFELGASAGRTTLLPDLRPSADLVDKRIRHGLRAMKPALTRRGLADETDAARPVEQARRLCVAVYDDMSFAERRALKLSILPVYTEHDEYLFLRVLQTFETTFALLSIQLRAAVSALADGDADRAVHFIVSSERALTEMAPMFSMLATMQVESFRTFRQFTDGASAIQSRNYKIIESLCRRPDDRRIDSVAYESVPEVRRRIKAGRQRTLDDAHTLACESGRLTADEQVRLADSMASFSDAMLRWRTTHHRLAVRMLGDAGGTGYTEGTPYLEAARTIPVFGKWSRDH